MLLLFPFIPFLRIRLLLRRHFTAGMPFTT